MTSAIRIEFAPEVADDFDRILQHLLEHERSDAAARVQDIIAAMDVLERNPAIGRPVDIDLHALVIGRGARGYVALYRYAEALGTIFVLAIRGQQESGYRRDLG
jgi:toxin ParE1/3/4